MPFVASRYPKDWKNISLRIRARSLGICECNGECGLHLNIACLERNGSPAHSFNGKVVLTVAHLNHIEMDCRDENLRAMCQLCHLSYDREQHQANSRKTRRSRKAHQELF